jgi:hypothetical protein
LETRRPASVEPPSPGVGTAPVEPPSPGVSPEGEQSPPAALPQAFSPDA